MNKEQLRILYAECKERWNENGKNILIDEDRIAKLCEYGEAISKILEQTNLEIDTMHGGYSFDEEDNIVISVVEKDNREKIAGTIKLGCEGINIQYITSHGTAEAYSQIDYNGDYTTGGITKITEDSELVTVRLGNKTYTVDKETYPFASENEVGKITEAYNALALESNKKRETYQY